MLLVTTGVVISLDYSTILYSLRMIGIGRVSGLSNLLDFDVFHDVNHDLTHCTLYHEHPNLTFLAHYT